MTRKRTVEYRVSEETHVPRQRILNDLSWYNNTMYSHLTAYISVDGICESTRNQIESIITFFRSNKDSQKSDPIFKILVRERFGSDFLTFLETLDCRLPRLAIVPHVCDEQELADMAIRLPEIRALLATHVIDHRFAVTLDGSASGLDLLCRGLTTLSGTPEGAAALRPFPIIEVPFSTGEDPAALADRMAALWSQWPQLNDSVNLSRGGYVKHFYAAKELWHLAQVMRQPTIEADLAALRQSYGLDAAAEQRVAAFDRTFLERHASLGRYQAWRHNSASVVLEFDLDSIADTYECQSPVFIDNRWILEGGSLQADESATTANP